MTTRQTRQLYESASYKGLHLKNRIVMAPMTRCRAIHNLPNEMMAKYYGQRSAAGLIITEGTSPSANGLGYARIPGLFNCDHVNSWRKVTDTVHQKGAKIFVQLMHTGRIGHPLNLPKHAKIFAPSGIAASGKMWTDQKGQQEFPTPIEMTEPEIANAIEEYAHSSRLAIQAGFDGVELHGANGYLIDQFLNKATNHRIDNWGGSVTNRIRFAKEVVKACVNAIGAEKIGIRISPYGVFNGMLPDSEMFDLYEKFSLEMNNFKIQYIHTVDHSSMGAPKANEKLNAKIRDLFKGRIILSGGYDLARANSDLTAGKGDLVAFGRPFIANPNFVEMMQASVPLKKANPEIFYSPGEAGYL